MVLTIAILADSTGGYAAPEGGTAIPQGATFVKNGVLQTAYSPNFAGFEVSANQCLLGSGFLPEVYVQNANGALTTWGQSTGFPALVATGVQPDVLVVSLGTNDSRTWSVAQTVSTKVLGPDYSQGPGFPDGSIAAMAREVWNQSLWIVIVEPATRNGGNVGLGFPSTGNQLHERRVRSDLQAACVRDSHCLFLDSSGWSTRDGIHLDTAGYGQAGRDLCGAVKLTLQ